MENRMNFLCLSDLHLRANDVVNAFEHDRLSDFMSQVKSGVAKASSDVVIVTGDTVCSAQIRLLSELLRKLIPGDVPIVVTLGNHEFWGRTFEETLAELKKQTLPTKTSFTWT